LQRRGQILPQHRVDQRLDRVQPRCREGPFFRGGGVAPASACRTVRQCTSYFSDNALIDRPPWSGIPPDRLNNSTRDPTPPPPDSRNTDAATVEGGAR
jgi:hypothetical protein